MKPTQNARILAALRRGRTLTMLDIFKLCGSMNGHKRIKECRVSDRKLHPVKAQPYRSYESFTINAIEPVWVKRNGRKLRAWKLA